MTLFSVMKRATSLGKPMISCGGTTSVAPVEKAIQISSTEPSHASENP